MKSVVRKVLCVGLLTTASLTMAMHSRHTERYTNPWDTNAWVPRRGILEAPSDSKSTLFTKKLGGLIALLQNVGSLYDTYDAVRFLWSDKKELAQNPWVQQPQEGILSYLSRVSDKGKKLLDGVEQSYSAVCNVFGKGYSLITPEEIQIAAEKKELESDLEALRQHKLSYVYDSLKEKWSRAEAMKRAPYDTALWQRYREYRERVKECWHVLMTKKAVPATTAP